MRACVRKPGEDPKPQPTRSSHAIQGRSLLCLNRQHAGCERGRNAGGVVDRRVHFRRMGVRESASGPGLQGGERRLLWHRRGASPNPDLGIRDLPAVKHFLLSAIRLYWRVWPTRLARTCVFRESCSRHVFRVTQEHGLWKGLQALAKRHRCCRAGYRFTTRDGGIGLVLADGSFIPEGEVAQALLLELHQTLTSIEVAMARKHPNAPASCSP